MQAYTVHEPPNPPPSRVKRAERLVFVREGFSWSAALFAPLWMLLHRMWLVLLLYVIVVAALDTALVAAGVSTHWVALATIGVHLALGFEIGALRRWTLNRKGWRMLGAVTGYSAADCERRFFEAWLDDGGEGLVDGSVRLGESPAAGAATPIGSRA